MSISMVLQAAQQTQEKLLEQHRSSVRKKLQMRYDECHDEPPAAFDFKLAIPTYLCVSLRIERRRANLFQLRSRHAPQNPSRLSNFGIIKRDDETIESSYIRLLTMKLNITFKSATHPIIVRQHIEYALTQPTARCVLGLSFSDVPAELGVLQGDGYCLSSFSIRNPLITTLSMQDVTIHNGFHGIS